MNNRGFTLVELLGVIVVLVAILLVAIPNISSTLERNKNKIDDNKKKNIISAAEIYFSIHDCVRSKCKLSINELLNEGLITRDEVLYSDGKNKITGYVEYNDNTFTLETTSSFANCTCD